MNKKEATDMLVGIIKELEKLGYTPYGAGVWVARIIHALEDELEEEPLEEVPEDA